MKYVMVVDNLDEESPILFPESITHRDVCGFSRVKIVSAGFCDKTTDGKWKAYGMSESLRKSSRPEDTELIRKHFNSKEIS